MILESMRGIKTAPSKQIEDLTRKNLALREMNGLLMGQPVQIEGQESILQSFGRDELNAAQYLADYLSGQENGDQIIDELFQDAQTFERLARQIGMIAALMSELDSLAPEDDFEGRKEARTMLGNLSLRLKRTARIAASRPGRLTTW